MPITSFSDVPPGPREPESSGFPAAATPDPGGQIRIRGSASLSQTNEPVIYLDGVRIDRGGGRWLGAPPRPRPGASTTSTPTRSSALKSSRARRGHAVRHRGLERRDPDLHQAWPAGRGALVVADGPDRRGSPAGPLHPARRLPQERGKEVARMQQRWGRQPPALRGLRGELPQGTSTTPATPRPTPDRSRAGADLITYFVSARVHDENGPFSNLDGILPNDQKLRSEDTIGRRQATMNIGIFPFDNLRLRVTGMYSELAQSRMRGRQQHLRRVLARPDGPAAACR